MGCRNRTVREVEFIECVERQPLVRGAAFGPDSKREMV
jgi:hypothetical protein